MRALIRRLTDNAALAEEVERLRAENKSLQRQISNGMWSGPGFRQVSKDFDPSKIEKATLDRIVDKLEPALRTDLIDVVLQMARDIDRRTPWIGASVADEIGSPVRAYRLRIKEFTTTIHGAIL